MQRFRRLLKLYITFFKVGLFTIGGGYAMLPIVERELVQDTQLTNMEVVLESYTLAQTLPGVIASNASALIGYKLEGILGAIFCVLGVITPSVGIILVVAVLFKKIEHLEVVQKAFKGIRVVVLALLMDSFLRLYKVAIFDKKTFIIGLVAFICVLFSLISPIWIILAGGLIGTLIYTERVGL